MSIGVFKLYENKIGGTEKAVENLIDILTKNSLQVRCFSAINAQEIQVREDNRKTYLFQDNTAYEESKLRFYIKYLFFLSAKSKDLELIISTDIATSSLLLLIGFFRCNKNKIICWEHYPFDKNSIFWRKVFKFLLSLNKKAVVVCNSHKEKDKFTFCKRVVIIPNSIKTQKYKRIHQGKETLDLIYIGRIVKDKGVERLINAVINHPSTKKYVLHIVGGGQELEYLKSKYKNNNQIHFHGPSLNTDVFLAKSDVFVSGSYFECFPVTILEAMSYGLPVISMDISGGTSSVISSSGGGFVCQSQIEFQEKLTYFEDNVKRTEHGNAGFLFVNRHYTEEIVSAQWMSLINRANSQEN
ncbi:glycosyltransferase [Escherichia coli]|uniref:glycosyltransferase n=1 Tax=Escherichia coli TaxID=562 RepID=UPI001B9F96F3|nr:glycosyltransferase [Escherichia coli]HBC8185217.1 glycosyltransferase [Escherichia coli]HBO5420968.1 glycosyltransferase [Escherichia coli]HCL9044531.1 glycosyltransferase [Escherichia coli]HDP7234042.1 glycosyltransferase [Escherichia coli]